MNFEPNFENLPVWDLTNLPEPLPAEIPELQFHMELNPRTTCSRYRSSDRTLSQEAAPRDPIQEPRHKLAKKAAVKSRGSLAPRRLFY